MAPKAKNSDQAWIELFLDMIAAERGGAKNTLAAYARDLADFSAELGQAGRTIAGASTDDLRGYLGSLARRRFAASSVARRLSAIRQLYRFLYAAGHRADDPSGARRNAERRSSFAPRASLVSWKCSTRPGCVSSNASSCRFQRPSAMRAC